jgi:hypothetical protein
MPEGYPTDDEDPESEVDKELCDLPEIPNTGYIKP